MKRVPEPQTKQGFNHPLKRLKPDVQETISLIERFPTTSDTPIHNYTATEAARANSYRLELKRAQGIAFSTNTRNIMR